MSDDGTRKQVLESSTDMVPVRGTVDLDVPEEKLWEAFRHANLWPRWNRCFFWANGRTCVAFAGEPAASRAATLAQAAYRGT